MHAVVVYESLYGNTAAVAEAIAAGLRATCDVTVLATPEATPEALNGADLLVVGAPTHAHGLPSPDTRRNAALRDGGTPWDVAESDVTAAGVRELLAGLSRSNGAAAAFDTRATGPRLVTGAASRVIASRLRRAGRVLALPPESFVVTATKGPLRDGETRHATMWGMRLASAAGAAVPQAAA